MAQYPLDMGRKKKMSNALAVQVDAEGKIKYDAIARQGQSKDKVIFFPNMSAGLYTWKRCMYMLHVLELIGLALPIWIVSSFLI